MQLKNDGTYGGIRVYTTMQLKNDGTYGGTSICTTMQLKNDGTYGGIRVYVRPCSLKMTVHMVVLVYDHAA